MATRALSFVETTIGKKIVMAVSGLVGFGFLLGHMAGNLLVFVGPEAMNEYSATLHSMPQLVWGTRIVLLAAIGAHVWSALSLVQRNHKARRYAYGNKQDIATSYAAKTMKYGGVVLLLFIVYHLLHLTAGWSGPVGYEHDVANVYNNVVFSFQNRFIALFYIIAQCALGLHLYHGLWSLFQTLGLNHPRYNGGREPFAMVFTLVVVLGFVSIPVSVLTGSLQPTEPGMELAENSAAAE